MVGALRAADRPERSRSPPDARSTLRPIPITCAPPDHPLDVIVSYLTLTGRLAAARARGGPPPHTEDEPMSKRGPGIVTLAILRAIQAGRRYGADIMEVTGLGGGTVYKTLGRLERRGWIEGRWEDPALAEAEKRPRRRFYELTPAGVAATDEALRRVARLTGQPSTA